MSIIAHLHTAAGTVDMKLTTADTFREARVILNDLTEFYKESPKYPWVYVNDLSAGAVRVNWNNICFISFDKVDEKTGCTPERTE